MGEIKNYIVRKVAKSLYDMNPNRNFYGKEIEYLEGTFQTLSQAKEAIRKDKERNGQIYKYAVAEDKIGRNEIIYQE